MNITETMVCLGLTLFLAGVSAVAGQGVLAGLTHAVQHWAGAITSAGGQ